MVKWDNEKEDDMTRLKRITRRTVDIPRTPGLAPSIVVTMYPDGMLGLRELRRRKEYLIPIVAVLTLAIRREVEAKRRKG